MSTSVPTGSKAIGSPNLYKKWWLRSPDTDIDGRARYVSSYGVVYGSVYGSGGVTRSYGRTISPDSFMYYNYTSFYVIEDGSMITYAVEYSYEINKFGSNFLLNNDTIKLSVAFISRNKIHKKRFSR